MPSFAHHYRNPTWPPHEEDENLFDSESYIYDSSFGPLPSLDDDPFSHFIAPITEGDDLCDALSWSAGIVQEPTEPKGTKVRASLIKKWARYIARNHEELHQRYHGDEEEEAAVPRPKKFAPRPDSDEPTKGRAQELLGPGSPYRAGRRARGGYTLSGHRHSWQEPSFELFTVVEERESEKEEEHPIEDDKRPRSDNKARAAVEKSKL